METDAIVTMVIAMLIIWGGLTASVAYAVKVHRAGKIRSPKLPEG